MKVITEKNSAQVRAHAPQSRLYALIYGGTLFELRFNTAVINRG
jgi:hypothetical protein